MNHSFGNISSSNEETLKSLRNIIQCDQNGFDFLLSEGYGSIQTRFSCEKTEFNEQGKLFMTIISKERDGATAIKVRIPEKVETKFRTPEEELDSKFMYQATGKVGSYNYNQPTFYSVDLTDVLKSMILFFQLQHVLVVQYDTQREYHFYGPSMAALVNRARALRETMPESMTLRTFLEKIRIALDKKFEVESGGKREEVRIFVDEERYGKDKFHVPTKESFTEGGKTYDVFRVQGVQVNPGTNGVMLDLGIYLDHTHNPNIQYVFTTLSEFEALYGLTPYRTVVHHSHRVNLSKPIQIGPLYYQGKIEPLEKLLTELVGVACVYLSAEPAPQTSFALEMKSVSELLVALDTAKEHTRQFNEPKSSETIALGLLDDMRTGACLQIKHKRKTQEDMVNERLREYQLPTRGMGYAPPSFSR
jgi:hypothetical protein